MHIRPRRLRRTLKLRTSLAETCLLPQHLMMPYFVVTSPEESVPIRSMPGIATLTSEQLLCKLDKLVKRGLHSVLLFGVPKATDKDPHGSAAWREDNPVALAIRRLKQEFHDELLVAADICLCSYTAHGHCGCLNAEGQVDNDQTLLLLNKVALLFATAGVDIIAPSDMMDGRIQAMRQVLDSESFTDTIIMSYAVKYASAYYGPFREAASSALKTPATGAATRLGDRQTYQLPITNSREALRELELDELEGADILMIKPALAYLDIVAKARERTNLPLAVYNVSGEYALLKAAALAGYIDEAKIVEENFLAMRRAGADLIISYHTEDWLLRP